MEGNAGPLMTRVIYWQGGLGQRFDQAGLGAVQAVHA
jgi:hypothetical protein